MSAHCKFAQSIMAVLKTHDGGGFIHLNSMVLELPPVQYTTRYVQKWFVSAMALG